MALSCQIQGEDWSHRANHKYHHMNREGERKKADCRYVGASIIMSRFIQSPTGIFRVQLNCVSIKEIRYDKSKRRQSTMQHSHSVVTQFYVNLSRFQMPYDILVVIVFSCSRVFFCSNLHIWWHTDADGALNSKPEIIVAGFNFVRVGPAYSPSSVQSIESYVNWNALTDSALKRLNM